MTQRGQDLPLVLVRGEATAEEVAALVAVLQARAPASPAPPPVVSEWSAPHRKVRVTYPHGRGGWRSSALPRPR